MLIFSLIFSKYLFIIMVMKTFASKPKGVTNMKDEIMTIKDLSLYLKINEKTIYRLAKQRKLPGVKIGGVWRFKKEAIDNWMMNAGKQIMEVKDDSD